MNNKENAKQRDNFSLDNIISINKSSINTNSTNLKDKKEKIMTNKKETPKSVSINPKNYSNNNKYIEIETEQCPCAKITNLNNIIFSNGFCKLCGESKFENKVLNTEGSLVNIGTSMGTDYFSKNKNNKIQNSHRDVDGRPNIDEVFIDVSFN